MTASFQKRTLGVSVKCLICGNYIAIGAEHVFLGPIRIHENHPNIIIGRSFHVRCFTQNIIDNLGSTESQQNE